MPKMIHSIKIILTKMKTKAWIISAILITGIATNAMAKKSLANNGVMTKQADGTYVVNTTTLAKDVKGFKGNTPLNIYIKSGKVVKIEPLANQESPNFFNKVKQGLLQKWYGMKANKASTANIDGVTGATFSSKAVKENVKRGLKYYMAHK